MDNKKNYIIIGAMRGYISGAPIYYRNKALYMKSKGWNVYCVSCRGGKAYIDGLEQFIVVTLPRLTVKPYLLSSKHQQRVISEIIRFIPNPELYTVIETSTYYTAYWGEILAQKLKAKHIIIYLDEHNVGINKQQINFYKLKYERKELACITDKAYQDIFASYWNLDKNIAYSLPCYCTNSLEDIPSKIVQETLKAEITIGYIGRLEKSAFNSLLDGLFLFAKKYPHKKIVLNCFGDYNSPRNAYKLKKLLSDYSNIQLYISGFLFPIPKQAITKCDICFGSAGSVFVATKANVPTIAIDVYSNQPNGFRTNPLTRECEICSGCTTVYDYLKVFFIDNFRPKMTVYNLKNDKLAFEKSLSQHIEFLDHSNSFSIRYYDISQIDMTIKEKLQKILYIILGPGFIACLKKIKHAICRDGLLY